MTIGEQLLLQIDATHFAEGQVEQQEGRGPRGIACEKFFARGKGRATMCMDDRSPTSDSRIDSSSSTMLMGEA